MNASVSQAARPASGGRFGGFATACRNATAVRSGRKGRKAPRTTVLHTIDYDAGEVIENVLPAGYTVIAPGELDDNIEDIFGPFDASEIRPLTMPAEIARHSDGTIMLDPATEALAAQIKAERLEASKLASAEARRIRNAEKRAAGLPLRAPSKKVTLTGRDIPLTLRGKPVITGRFIAKTGEALIIDVTYRNKTHAGIVVWSGQYQAAVAEAAAANKALDFTIAQPANDRFKPSVRTAA